MKSKQLFSFFCILFLFTSCDVLRQVIDQGAIPMNGFNTLTVSQLLKEQPAVTTSFSTDVVTEVSWLDDFQPEPKSYLDANLLPRTGNGSYILSEGLFFLETNSYCIKAGTYGPSHGDGYVYAPLAGPKANIIRKLIENSYDDNQITQEEVQRLIWAVIARHKFSEMPQTQKATALKLLSPLEVQQLNGGLWALAPKSIRYRAIQSLSPALQKIYLAEQKMRQLLNDAETSYAQLEDVAVLTGMPSWGETIRPTPSGRWAYNPNGFFIRFFPRSYQNTRVELYVPTRCDVRLDEFNRVQTIEYGRDLRLTFQYDSISYTRSSLQRIWLQSIKSGEAMEWEVESVGIQHSSTAEETKQTRNLEYTFGILVPDENNIALASLEKLHFALNETTLSEDTRKLLQKMLAESRRFLVYRELRAYDRTTPTSRSDGALQKLKSVRKKAAGVNQLQFGKSTKVDYTENQIIYDPIENVATPAVTSKQRLAISPKPESVEKFVVKFYAYPPFTKIKKKGEEEKEKSSPGHIFVGFFRNDEIEEVKGFGPDGKSYWAPSGLSEERHLIKYATDFLAVSVDRTSYYQAKSIRKIGYFIGINDCVSYADDVAEAIGLNTPDITDVKVWPPDIITPIVLQPIAFLQFLKEQNSL